MGVQGLLGLLKSIHKPCHLRDFKGKTLAVDAYGWLHRGAVACAIELATDKPTTKVLDFVMHRVRMLIHFGVTPYLVFDGDRLPSKAATERGRHERRKEARKQGMEYLRLGKISMAHQEMQKAVDITPEIARMFIETLKVADIRYVVAPYEADSQMVYLEQKGIVDGIISEDSDLLVFGAKCLLTKLDQYGECVMVNKEHFTRCREVNLTGWSNTEFRTMAILNGCDYLDGINKMGLKTAHRLVRKYKHIDNIIRGAMLENKLRIPPTYKQDFLQAERTFLYQWVFCPASERLVHFQELPESISVADLPFIGESVEPEIARQVAEGELDPMSKEKIFLTSQQWADVRKHLEKAPMRRTKPVPTPAIAAKPKETPSKAIENFFKPKRMPLADLDPNAFEPSTSQRRVLDDDANNRSWEARPTSNTENQRPTVQRSYSTPIPVSAPPPKRRRLCEDSPSKTSAQTERSKFFGGTKTTVQPSPLKVRKSKQKSLDFRIFSDDSEEDAMAELADTDTKPKSGARKITVYKDEVTVKQEEAATLLDAEAQMKEEPDPSPAASQGEDVSPFAAALQEETKSLRKRTSLQAFALDTKPTSPATIAPRRPSPRASKSFTLGAGTVLTGKARLETPQKPSSAPDAPALDDVIWDSPPTQRRPQTSLHDTASSLKFSTPAWLPEDSGYGSQLEAMAPKGSEDWLPQNSDSELNSSRRGSAVEDVCVAGSSPMRGDEGQRLNLGRFAFGA